MVLAMSTEKLALHKDLILETPNRQVRVARVVEVKVATYRETL